MPSPSFLVPGPGAHAYGYVRFSSKRQVLGHSEQRQQEDGIACAKRHRWEYVEVIDRGLSAFYDRHRNDKNGALHAFLEAIEADALKRPAVLMIENLDRLSRRTPYEAWKLFSHIIEADVPVVILSGLPDSYEESEEIYTLDRVKHDPNCMQKLLGEMTRAHKESLRKSRLVGDAWKANKAAVGQRMLTAKCPWWVRPLVAKGKRVSPDERFELDEERAHVLAEATRMLATRGARDVQLYLRDSGVKPPNGRTWHAATLIRWIKSDLFLGYYTPHDVVDRKRTPSAQGRIKLYPAIVDEATLHEARLGIARRRLNGRGHGGRKGKGYSNLFHGLLDCRHCDGAMRMRTGDLRRRSPRFLQCGTTIEHGSCDHRVRYPYDKFEDALIRSVGEIDLRALDKQRNRQARLVKNAIAAEIMTQGEIKQRIDRYLDLFDRGKLASHEARERFAKHEADKRESETKLAQLRAREAELLSARKQLADRQKAIDDLHERQKKADERERYDIRAQLASEVARVIESMTFDDKGPDGEPIVTVNLRRVENSGWALWYTMRRQADGSWDHDRVTWKDLDETS